MPQNRLESHIFPRMGSLEGNFILQRRRERSCKYLALLGSTHQLWGLGPRRQLMNGNMIHLLCEVKEFWSQAGRREGWASQEHAPTSTKAEKTALGTTSINFIFLEASDRKRAREREGRRETERSVSRAISWNTASQKHGEIISPFDTVTFCTGWRMSPLRVCCSPPLPQVAPGLGLLLESSGETKKSMKPEDSAVQRAGRDTWRRRVGRDQESPVQKRLLTFYSVLWRLPLNVVFLCWGSISAW